MRDPKIISQTKWYAIYTKPRFEKKVLLLLENEGFEVYTPMIKTIRQWSDRKKKVIVPLIPSYVFIKIEELKLNNLLKYNGVVGILKYLKKPAVVKDYEINNLKIICESPDLIEDTEVGNFKINETVQITGGPFTGLYGEYIKQKGKHKVLLHVASLGLIVTVHVPLSFVERLKVF